MSYQENRELARIRSELRMRLISRRYDDSTEILKRLQQAAERAPEHAGELRNEYERWRIRFEMLAAR